MEHKYNLKSPAVKRLMREAKELYEPTEQYYAQPLEDNLFEWHFTVQGAADTDFECGRYHGRIILPPEYPMKPPSIMLLTPNGRFEIGKKICLSMSAHHPETWQPSWSIRTVLLAIIGFMPSKGGGAIGALDYTPEERKTLARKSMTWTCNVCGSCNSDSLKEAEPGSQKTMNGEAEELASQINFKGENEKKLEETTDIPDGTIADSTWTPDNGSLNNRNGEGLNTIGKSTSEELSAETDDVTSRADVVTANKNTDTPIRRRGSKRPSVKHGSPSVSVTTSEPTARERSSCFSTILIVILATCFVLLLLRRIFKE